MIWKLALLSVAAFSSHAGAAARIGQNHNRVAPRQLVPSNSSSVSPPALYSPAVDSLPTDEGKKSDQESGGGYNILPESRPVRTALTTVSTPKTDGGDPKTSQDALGSNSIPAPPLVPSRSPDTIEKEPPSTTVPSRTWPPMCGFAFCTSRAPLTTYSPSSSTNGTWKSLTGFNTTDTGVLTKGDPTITATPTPTTIDDDRETKTVKPDPEEKDPAEEPGEGESDCTPTREGDVPTTWSIIYTATTTIYGNASSTYTPEYPAITTPVTCKEPLVDKDRGGYDFTISCTTIKSVEQCTTQTLYKVSWAPDPVKTTTTARAAIQQTVTFLTTEKNPSVVYAPDTQPPNYGRTTQRNEHTSVDPDDMPPQSNFPSRPIQPESMKLPVTPEYKVTVAPTEVIINDRTVTVAPDATTTVTIDNSEFVINPTEVIGGGAVIQRPVPPPASLPSSTSTNIGGLDVVITSSTAVIGGATFSIGPQPTTVTISGQTVSIGTRGVGVGGSVTVGGPPAQTEIVVAGGEMITAIGPTIVVVRSTTITYGPGQSARTEVIDDDTIIIGPSAVTVHSTTIGGPRASPRDTTYEIVGGATITQAGPSVVIVGGGTYTVGPGGPSTTTTVVVGGETVTIGPSGVSVSTLSFPYPFGPTVVTTIRPSPTAPAPTPSETSENAAGGVGPGRPGREGWIVLGACIAVGVWILGSSPAY